MIRNTQFLGGLDHRTESARWFRMLEAVFFLYSFAILRLLHYPETFGHDVWLGLLRHSPSAQLAVPIYRTFELAVPVEKGLRAFNSNNCGIFDSRTETVTNSFAPLVAFTTVLYTRATRTRVCRSGQ